MKLINLALGSTLMFACSAMATPASFGYVEAKNANDVFSVKEPGKASFVNSYMPYAEWKEKQTGRFFPMEVSPVLAGMALGGVNVPAPMRIDPAAYKAQAKEFADVVNNRNSGGRPEAPPSALPIAKRLSDDQTNTYVVQTVLSTVLPRSFSQLKLNPENFFETIMNADLDHYHFRIPGSFALQALDSNHSAAKSINPSTAYLLSVIDFRQYGCAAMKDGLRDYFSKEENKKKLMNESMYLISDLSMNAPQDLAAAEKLFGKRPDAALGQSVIYADRLIRGARTLFFFYNEGQNTRVVLVSNIGMQSKHFVGVKGALTRGVILNGITAGLSGALVSTKDALSSILGGANQDVQNKNSCDKGLAKGLIRYAKDLFGELTGNL